MSVAQNIGLTTEGTDCKTTPAWVMKYSILTIALILTASSCNTQNKEQQSEEQQNNIEEQIDLSFIDNKSIEHGFFRVLNTTVAPFVHYPGFYVRVGLTEEEYEIVQKLDKQTWLNLLNSPNSDFAANLILYYIYDKDGIALYVWDSDKGEDSFCELWQKHLKGEDLDYWKEHLDSLLVQTTPCTKCNGTAIRIY